MCSSDLAPINSHILWLVVIASCYSFSQWNLMHLNHLSLIALLEAVWPFHGGLPTMMEDPKSRAIIIQKKGRGDDDCSDVNGTPVPVNVFKVSYIHYLLNVIVRKIILTDLWNLQFLDGYWFFKNICTNILQQRIQDN